MHEGTDADYSNVAGRIHYGIRSGWSPSAIAEDVKWQFERKDFKENKLRELLIERIKEHEFGPRAHEIKNLSPRLTAPIDEVFKRLPGRSQGRF